MFELAGDCAGGAGGGVGFLDLTEELRLANDPGVETGGDADEMARLVASRLAEAGATLTPFAG